MTIRFIEAKPNEKAIRELAHTKKSLDRAIRLAWFALGKDLKSEANREILHGQKSGRVYVIRQRGGGRRRHRASAPGQTHANLTGRLRRSVSYLTHGTDSMSFGYGVSVSGARAPKYAPFVEFGTRRMAARPSLENAINAVQRQGMQHFEEFTFREFNR